MPRSQNPTRLHAPSKRADSITRAEWRAVNKRQIAAICAELKRRGDVVNDSENEVAL